MKKRKPDILYDGFKGRLFDHESIPDPALKEKIFNQFFSETLKTEFTEKNTDKSLIHWITNHSYLIAASFAGILILGYAVFYISTLKINKDIIVNDSKKNDYISNSKPVIIKKEIASTESKIQKMPITDNLSGISNDHKTSLITHKTGHDKEVIILPDSSKLYLNKYSEISYSNNFKDGERNVTMSGEVYFDVRNSKNRPFIVYTKISKVKVLGTSFSIKSTSQEREEVIVESGRVEFSEKNNEEKNKLVLNPGMKAYLEPGKQISNVTTDHINDLAWKTNKLIFNETPVKQVIEKIESYFDVKVNVNGTKIQGCHFTGTFDQPKSLDDVLQIISLSINGSFEIKNKEYILTSKGCN